LGGAGEESLLAREQHWLNWLFSLPAELRYNFLSTAGSPLGLRHTEEAKTKMSEAKKGRNIKGRIIQIMAMFPLMPGLFLYTT
jgi:hypothetical protein